MRYLLPVFDGAIVCWRKRQERETEGLNTKGLQKMVVQHAERNAGRGQERGNELRRN